MLVSKASVIFSFFSIVVTLFLVPFIKIYGVYIVAILIPLVYFIYLFIKEPYQLKMRFDLKETLRLIKIGLPLISSDFLSSFTISIAGIIVFSFLGKEAMGYYAVAMLASRFLVYLPNSVIRIFEPYIYQRYGETEDIVGLKKYLFKPTFIMAFLFPIVMAYYYIMTTFFIRHFLPRYYPSIIPFFIILIGRFFTSFSPTTQIFITAINKQRYLLPIYIAGALIMAVASLVFINMGFGIIGVSLGLLLSFFFTGVVIFIFATIHYLKSLFRCLGNLFILSMPFLYIMFVLIISDIIIPYSKDIVVDIGRSTFKLCILTLFSLPLAIIVEHKTSLIGELIRFLNPVRFIRTMHSIEAW